MKALPVYLQPLFRRYLIQVLCLYLCLLGYTAGAQQPTTATDTVMEKKPLVQVAGSLQFWLRYTELNPGSVVVDKERKAIWDISIRRYRIRLHGNATEKLRYTLEFGNNDLNVTKGGQDLPQLLDAYLDYQWHRHHGIGIGKQAWVGPARYAAPATTQALAYDIDFVAAPLVNVHDDILRRLKAAQQGYQYVSIFQDGITGNTYNSSFYGAHTCVVRREDFCNHYILAGGCICGQQQITLIPAGSAYLVAR